MTKNDVVNLFRVICVLWPQSARTFAAADELMRDTWHAMLSDESAEVIGAALKKHAATNEWPPSIAQIRETIARIRCPENNIDADEAWGMVVAAIRKYGVYRQEEGIGSLPPIVANTVRTFGWRDLCMSENIAVDRGQFRKAYEIRLAREREKAAIPLELRNELDRLAQGNIRRLPLAPDFELLEGM